MVANELPESSTFYDPKGVTMKIAEIQNETAINQNDRYLLEEYLRACIVTRAGSGDYVDVTVHGRTYSMWGWHIPYENSLHWKVISVK